MNIASVIKNIRLSKKIFQADLDKMAGLPKSTIAKIETGRRDVSAIELLKISKALGVSINAFYRTGTITASLEELDIVEALRIVSFEKYEWILETLEADIYFKAKEEKSDKKTRMRELVLKLSDLRLRDQRPRSSI